MASERTKELYKVLLDRGYPKEFCAEIAFKNMNTDYTATRMLGYLYPKPPRSPTTPPPRFTTTVLRVASISDRRRHRP